MSLFPESESSAPSLDDFCPHLEQVPPSVPVLATHDSSANRATTRTPASRGHDTQNLGGVSDGISVDGYMSRTDKRLCERSPDTTPSCAVVSPTIANADVAMNPWRQNFTPCHALRVQRKFKAHPFGDDVVSSSCGGDRQEDSEFTCGKDCRSIGSATVSMDSSDTGSFYVSDDVVEDHLPCCSEEQSYTARKRRRRVVGGFSSTEFFSAPGDKATLCLPESPSLLEMDEISMRKMARSRGVLRRLKLR